MSTFQNKQSSLQVSVKSNDDDSFLQDYQRTHYSNIRQDDIEQHHALKITHTVGVEQRTKSQVYRTLNSHIQLVYKAEASLYMIIQQLNSLQQQYQHTAETTGEVQDIKDNYIRCLAKVKKTIQDATHNHTNLLDGASTLILYNQFYQQGKDSLTLDLNKLKLTTGTLQLEKPNLLTLHAPDIMEFLNNGMTKAVEEIKERRDYLYTIFEHLDEIYEKIHSHFVSQVNTEKLSSVQEHEHALQLCKHLRVLKVFSRRRILGPVIQQCSHLL